MNCAPGEIPGNTVPQSAHPACSPLPTGDWCNQQLEHSTVETFFFPVPSNLLLLCPACPRRGPEWGGAPEALTGVLGGHHWVEPTPEFGAGKCTGAGADFCLWSACLLLLASSYKGRGV